MAEFMIRCPFLERPSKLTGPVSYFEIKVSRKVGCVLASNEVHFVSLAENFTTLIWNGKQNSLTGPVITGSFEKRAPEPHPKRRVFFQTIFDCSLNNQLFYFLRSSHRHKQVRYLACVSSSKSHRNNKGLAYRVEIFANNLCVSHGKVKLCN